MRKILHLIFIFSNLLFFSCSQQKEQERPNTFAPKVVEANGYVVPKDSMGVALVIPVDESKLTKIAVGNPLVVPTNTNVHPAGIPKIVIAGIPRVIVPGQDTFLLPKIVPAIDSPFVAGIPEVVIAKDAYVKDQNPEGFSSFSKLQGLKHNTIRCMLQDKIGNLWIGTAGGVSKYDGKSFTHFTEKEGLSNNIVLSMLEDKSGNLWFGTWGGGVSKYDGKSFTHFTEKEGLCNSAVVSMLEDKSGNLWFGTAGGVSKYDGKSFTHFTEKEGLSNNIVLSMLEDISGNLWFGSYGGGVSKFDGKSFTHFTEKEGLSNNDVRSILEDKSGNLWFCTDGGVSKYDGNRVEAIEDAEKRGELIPQRTQQDLKKINGKLVKSFTHFTEKEGLSNNSVGSILEDKSGNLWFGTNGGGVSKYDGKSFTHFTEKEGLSNNTVRSILEDKSGNLWFGTDGGVSKYDGKSFTHFTEKEGLSNNTVWSILEDKGGNLWFGTEGGGVSKYDGKSFTYFTEKEGLSNNSVLSMLEDKSGNLWFGSRFGLAKLSYEKLVEINDKVKFNKIQADEILFKNYTYEDGFLGIGVNGGKTICEDKNGTIWVAANERLTAFHPQGENTDTFAPNIQLTSIALFNENIKWVNLEKKKDSTLTLGNGVSVGNFEFDGITKWYGLPENLSLAYNNNYLTFNFIGITQKQSKKVKYQYKLEGIDENWSAITNRTEAPYGNLPHGTYIFKVKAMNSEGYWSEEFHYTFTIRPPWWKTIWFRTLAVFSLLFTLYLLYRWRTASMRARQKQLENTIHDRTREVVHQKELIEEKQKEITDSINYAKRIQYSLLAHDDLLKNNLPEHFVLFKPKDIVSGDFYWATEKLVIDNVNRQFYLAVCDSTGHGVPGAFMSLLNISFLNEGINEKNIIEPNKVFDHVRNRLTENVDGGADGMDAILIQFDFEKNRMHYTAANNAPLLIRNNTIQELQKDKMSVGRSDKTNPFQLFNLTLEKGDCLYFYTDGYADQFGGEKGKKFKNTNLNKLLLEIHQLPLTEQNEKLIVAFEKWRGDLEQVDDVCVIGIRI